jgi:integrase
VFADEAGCPLAGFHVSRRFKGLLAVAGLPPMRYHDLRHGAASLMAAQSVPVRVAMEILGHSQISTTMNVYAHMAPELGRDATDRIGAALGEPEIRAAVKLPENARFRPNFVSKPQ